MSWNVIAIDESRYELINGSETVVSFSRRAAIDLAKILSDLEELSVPISFTKGLKSIRFTILRKDFGNYRIDDIRVSCEKNERPHVLRTLIHELGHHVDQLEDISETEGLLKEKIKCAKFLKDPQAKKNVLEYVAIGFEFFYLGSKEEKRLMRTKNKILFKKIKEAHKKYSLGD